MLTGGVARITFGVELAGLEPAISQGFRPCALYLGTTRPGVCTRPADPN